MRVGVSLVFILEQHVSALTMGVHDDNLDSKYGVIGKPLSSFTKIAPKRPNTIVFHDKPNKIAKTDVAQNDVAEISEKTKITIQQQRKSLPVNRIRKK